MAGMIRKAFPSVVVPMSLRPMGPYSINLNHTISALKKQRDGSLYQSHSLSSIVGDKDLVSASLYKLLKHEMKSVKFKLNNSQERTLPDSLFSYEIDEPHGLLPYYYSDLVLKRKILDDAETITVRIKLDDVDKKEFVSSNEIKSENDKERDMSKKDIKAPAIPMIVIVEKPATNDRLQIKINVSTEDTTIQSFGNGETLDQINFKELDIELQQSLYKYLAIRGITSNLVSFSCKCMAAEKYKHYLRVLKDLVEFIEN